MNEIIKELFERFNKGHEDWEDFFGREIPILLKEERIKTLEEVKEKIIEELDMYEIIIKDMRDKEYDGKQIITALINNIKN
jgi:hypothetical protein